MRRIRVPLSLILIPALIAGSADTLPRSVRKLLNKPRYGQARLTFVDGTQAGGTVVRVTAQFVTFSSTRCENIEVKRIAVVEFSPPGNDESISDYATVTVLAVVWAPVWVPWLAGYGLKTSLAPRNPMFGKWQATSTNGAAGRIELRKPDEVQRSGVIQKTGRYRVADGKVDLTYDADGGAETIPFRFECDQLILDRTSGSLAMRDSVAEHRAAEPIVGQWRDGTEQDWTEWDFHPDGAFEAKIVSGRRRGTFIRSKNTLKINWGHPAGWSSEQWTIRTKNHHLFVTTGDVTTEYERAPRKADVTAP